jgi:hypothetical protein
VKLWRGFFAFAAFFNLAVGGAMAAGAGEVAAQAGLSGPAASYAIAFGGLCVAAFGVAYAMVAADPVRNRNLVIVGAVSKIAAGVLTAYHGLAGNIPKSTFYLGLGDFVWLAFFLVFLWQTRAASSSAPLRGSN